MILVPLQVFANVATIVLDESGPAVKGWFTWRDIFHLLDIICCCAILFPIVWSIKHLRDAAQTDGKVRAPASFVPPPTTHARPSRCLPQNPIAHGHTSSRQQHMGDIHEGGGDAAGLPTQSARNVVKLTLFRQFYVMVVSYIYFTRIVVYLLKSTTPYQYVWISDAAGELATLAFYSITGYLFRPASDNPYFALEPEEIEDEDSL